MTADRLPSSSDQAFKEQFVDGLVSRKFLLQNPVDNNLSGNVLMLLSVLNCGIFCCLGLHYIIRCAFRRSLVFMTSDPISCRSTPHHSSNKGIKKKALRMFPVVNYSPEMNLPGLGKKCVICLSDFVSGEQLRMLPKCNHGYHVRCIDKWLQQHLTCPKCRHCLIETCPKIVGFSVMLIQWQRHQ